MLPSKLVEAPSMPAKTLDKDIKFQNVPNWEAQTLEICHLGSHLSNN